ncbi:MAG: NAD(P)/FAD-dependent oxidoreductase [Opitutales bacterium]
MRADFIIVGQGLAGTLLAEALIAAGRRVIVVDDGWRSSSSRVAAGLMTPLTGRRFTLTPGYPELFARASATLGALGVLRPARVYRMFVDAEQRERGLSRVAEASCAPFIERVTAGPGAAHETLDDPLGGALMRGAWTDLPRLLSEARERLRATGSLVEESFDCDALACQVDGVVWKGLQAGGAVFCDGYKSALAGPFRNLGWQPAKGEALTLVSGAPQTPFILNREGWALPMGGDVWRTGTNWEWGALDESPTAEQKDKLLARFRGYFKGPVATEVTTHQAGVRPCTGDGRPYLGTHPALPRLHLFNGLGPRGTVWAPQMAEIMARHLIAQEAIPPEVDLRRAWRA